MRLRCGECLPQLQPWKAASADTLLLHYDNSPSTIAAVAVSSHLQPSQSSSVGNLEDTVQREMDE
jgi:hypothetical protein